MKLAIYMKEGDTPVVLDASNYERGHSWTIGRAALSEERWTHIQTQGQRVSKVHCSLRYHDDDGIWQIRDGKPDGSKVSTNGLWLDDLGKVQDIRIKQGWNPIYESQRYFLGDRNQWILCSYAIDETLESRHETETVVQQMTEALDIDNPWEALYHGLRGVSTGRLLVYGALCLCALALWLLLS